MSKGFWSEVFGPQIKASVWLYFVGYFLCAVIGSVLFGISIMSFVYGHWMLGILCSVSSVFSIRVSYVCMDRGIRL